MSRLVLKIFGRVQGVFFRMFVEEQANKLGLVGWVRNLADGTVEAVIEGDEQSLKEMLAVSKQGSSPSRVDKIEEEWGEATGEFNKFEIRY